jgi:metal-responsive CopG/Arc/MetJ family transcriptional regulator
MLGPTVELDKSLWARVQEAADARGYSSPREFVEHLIEQELAKGDQPATEEEAARRLKGIGYIDAGRDI